MHSILENISHCAHVRAVSSRMECDSLKLEGKKVFIRWKGWLKTKIRRLVQNKPSPLIRWEENKVEFLETQFHSEKLSFIHKKESGHSSGLFLSIFVFLRGIFTHKMQNFRLENHHMINARQPFCWRMTSARVPNPLFNHPLRGWPFYFCWGGGMGNLVWVRTFFPNLWS